MPPKLNDSSEFATLLVGATNGLSGGVVDSEHTGTIPVATFHSLHPSEILAVTLSDPSDPSVSASATGIITSVPAPDDLMLARLANSAYGSQISFRAYPGYGADGEHYDAFGTSGDIGGFRVDTYRCGNEIVLAFRGTDPGSTFNALKGLLADSSWVTGSVDPTLARHAQQAVAFLQKVHADHPDATLTLTGHSLGGALAEILGQASGIRTVTFNAPGAAGFAAGLATTLQPIRNSTSDGSVGGAASAGSRTNYRIGGDQFH